MREFKFRGISKKTGKWIYGYYLKNRGIDFIAPDEFAGDKTWEDYEVIPETVGQFTGLLDKNGKEIWEGDVIEIKEIGGYGCKRKGVVEYDVNECAFVVRVLRPSWAGIVRLSTKAQICADGNCTHEYFNQYTVIGNIHDTPELLKTETL